MAAIPETIIKQARLLIENEDYNGAYRLLTPDADNYSDIAEFSYLYGLVLLKLEKHSLAVFSLERALLVRPDDIQTMEALAQSYTQIKEFTKANEMLAKINEKKPQGLPSSLIKNLKNLYSPPDGRYKFTSFLGTTLGYDSNLTSGPNNSYMIFPTAKSYGLMFVGDNLEKKDDFFITINGGTSLSFKLNEQYGINMGMYGSHRLNNRRPDEDLAFLSGWLGGSYQKDKNRFDLSVRRQSIWLSEADYQDQYNVLGQWNRALQINTTLSLYTQASTLRYPNAHNLDADSYTVGTILYHQLKLPWTPLISAEAYGGELRIKGGGDTYEGYESIGGRLSNIFHLNENNELLIMGTAENRHYKTANTYFLSTRNDMGYSVMGKLSHNLLNKKLTVSLQCTWLLNKSNFELYDYKRNLAAFNLQWNF